LVDEYSKGTASNCDSVKGRTLKECLAKTVQDKLQGHHTLVNTTNSTAE